jgi:hypothetical protein
LDLNSVSPWVLRHSFSAQLIVAGNTFFDRYHPDATCYSLERVSALVGTSSKGVIHQPGVRLPEREHKRCHSPDRKASATAKPTDTASHSECDGSDEGDVSDNGDADDSVRSSQSPSQADDSVGASRVGSPNPSVRKPTSKRRKIVDKLNSGRHLMDAEAEESSPSPDDSESELEAPPGTRERKEQKNREKTELQEDRDDNDSVASSFNSDTSVACENFCILDNPNGHCEATHTKTLSVFVLCSGVLIRSASCSGEISPDQIETTVYCVYSRYNKSTVRLRECSRAAHVSCLLGSGFSFIEGVGWLCFEHLGRDDILIQQPKGFLDPGVPVLVFSNDPSRYGTTLIAFVTAEHAKNYTSRIILTEDSRLSVLGRGGSQVSTLDASVDSPTYVVCQNSSGTTPRFLTVPMLSGKLAPADVKIAVESVIASAPSASGRIGKSGGLFLCKTDLETVNKGKWLNDQMINSLIQEIPSKFAGCFAFSSFFFFKLTTTESRARKRSQEGDTNRMPLVGYPFNYSNVERWAKNVSLVRMDTIIIPINIVNYHWFVAFIFPRRRMIQVFDSLGTPRRAELEVLWRYWVQRDLDERKTIEAASYSEPEEELAPLDPTQWQLIDTRATCAQQADANSCGVMCIGNAIAVTNGMILSGDTGSEENITNLRVLIQHAATNAPFSAMFGKRTYVFSFAALPTANVNFVLHVSLYIGGESGCGASPDDIATVSATVSRRFRAFTIG